jgi:hypothetical protein
MQRKKINLAVEKKQKNAAAAASASQAGSSGGQSKTTNRNKTNSRHAGPSSKPSFPKVRGGMEDVD